MSKHDKLLEKIVNRLNKSLKYTYVVKNINYDFQKGNKIYHNSKRLASEIDIVALREIRDKDYWLVFEIKSSDASKLKRKGYKQLSKHKEAFGSTVDKMYSFLVTGQGNKYKVEWIR